MQARDAFVLRPLFAGLSAAFFTQYLCRIGFLATYDITHDNAALDSLREAINEEIKDLK